LKKLKELVYVFTDSPSLPLLTIVRRSFSKSNLETETFTTFVSRSYLFTQIHSNRYGFIRQLANTANLF